MATNVPKDVPRCLTEGIAFVPSAGARLAPEILILELYREIFYKKFSEGKSKPLDIMYEEPDIEKCEMAVLEATRGRKRLQVGQPSKPFYAPAYPEQAGKAWLRTQSDRVVRDHLLRGPIGEVMAKWSDSKKERWTEDTVKSLLGNHRSLSRGTTTTEILWGAISNQDQPKNMLNEQEASENLLKLVTRQKSQLFAPAKEETDPLAQRIFNDFNVIIRIEEKMARMQWLEVLKTFVRFATSVWLLSHMKVISFLHHWMMAVIEEGHIATQEVIADKIRHRYEALLQPTLEPTNERAEHISRFMQARVKASCLLKEFEQFDTDKLLNKELTLTQYGAEYLTISELLIFIKSTCQKLDMAGLSPDSFVTRKAEAFESYLRPLKVGVGKQIDEFLRVLRRLSGDDFDQAYLETQQGGRGRNKSIVFPGPALIRLVAFLAHRDESERKRKSRKLLLSDVERHFGSYGIDFDASATARPRLIESLQQQGLLHGSPDAGDSATITPAF